MIQEILKTIEQGRRFLVASHESPDGDALASTLSLVNALREMGKDVVAFNPDGVPEPFSFLPGASSVVRSLAGEAPFDAAFVLDAGELHRAGKELPSLCRSVVNIDHHPCSDFGDLQLVDVKASATGALIYRLLMAGKWPISSDVALCIYTAILSDTGSFRYSNADPEAFEIAAKMVGLGVNPWDVASCLYESQPAARLRLLAQALSTLTVSSCGLYASVTVTSEMYRQTGSGPEHTDGFVNYPRSVSGVEVALFFRQVAPAAFKVGFRSKGRIDVGALSRELGGGGHHNAAGAVVEGDLELVRASVFARMDELLGAVP